MAGFLVEHNLPIAVADHIAPLVKDIFPDSKIALGYSCGKTKASCILNRAIKPDLQIDLIKKKCKGQHLSYAQMAVTIGNCPHIRYKAAKSC